MVKFLNYLKSLNQNDKSRHSIYITYIGLKIIKLKMTKDEAILKIKDQLKKLMLLKLKV